MKVTLINFTGNGQEDPARWAARHLIFVKSTRLELTPNLRKEIDTWGDDRILLELAAIRDTIRSSWEFVDYEFLLQGVTRAFTHQLVRTRTASYAQQTMRATDQNCFTTEMPDSIREGTEQQKSQWNDCMDAIRFSYAELTKSGVPPQDARGVLPTNIHTNIVVKMNLRTLADMAAKRMESKRAQGEYRTAANWMVELACSVHPWVRDFLIIPRLSTPILDCMFKDALPGSPEWEAMKEVDKLKRIWG